jgi:hypothetical protein
MSTNWEPGTRALVRELEREFPGIRFMSTYPDHGVPGERWSIDVWIAEPGRFPTDPQENVGDAIQRHVIRNWNRIGIGYVIWFRYARQDNQYRVFSNQPAHTWFDYKPYALVWIRNHPGDNDPETYYHYDHFHISRRPGDPYRPPGG